MTSLVVSLSIITCSSQNLPNRRRRMSLVQAKPIYSSDFVFDKSPFSSGYTSRIPKSVNYHKTVMPRGFKDSQDFNVGYSLSLDSGKQTSAKFPVKNNFEYSDIITGSPKSNSNPYFPDRKLKYTNIQSSAKDSFGKSLSDANLTPRTQNYFNALESNQNTKSWENISPNIEIFQSREIPLNQKFTSNNLVEQTQNFDHQNALGKSQGFDYSNVIDGQFSNINANQKNNFQFDSAVKETQTVSNNFNHLAGTTVSLNNFQKPTTIDLTNYQSPGSETNFQQFDAKAFPQIEAAFQNTPKFPLDTHLLKEAGIITDVKSNSNGDALSSQIDTSMIDNFKPNTDVIKTSAFSQTIQQPQFQQIQPQLPQAQSFKPRPQFRQPKQGFENFQEQKMLHFDNGATNNYDVNLFGNIQKMHGFRKGTYNVGATSPNQSGLKFKNNFNLKNNPEPYLGTFRMNVDLKPPPITRMRYRPKSKRFF